MSSSLQLAKSTLRNELKNRLRGITADERERQSRIVTQKVLNSKYYKESHRVCIYLSMDEEISTMSLLKDIFKSGKTCFVPRYTKMEMDMLQLNSWEDYESLPLTKWNIRQPGESETRNEALSSGGLDLVLVPGLGFTGAGQRIGRGKGYYDRYLQKCEAMEKPPIYIGLAFKEQIVDMIPCETTDIKLHHIFYPDS